MGPNRVRTSIKRGTPLMTHNFWAYGIVESDPHTSILNSRLILIYNNYKTYKS